MSRGEHPRRSRQWDAGNPLGAGTRFEWLRTDCNNAHVQPTGAYHYHGLPKGLINRLGEGVDGATDMIAGGPGGPYDGTFRARVITPMKPATSPIAGPASDAPSGARRQERCRPAKDCGREFPAGSTVPL